MEKKDLPVKKKKSKELLIFQAMEEVSNGKFYYEISIDLIAEKAGVGKGTIYRYFKDKEDLFIRFVEYGFQQLCNGLQAELKENISSDFRTILINISHKIRTFFKGHKAALRTMSEHEGRMTRLCGENRRMMEKSRLQLREAVAQAMVMGINQGRVKSSMDPLLLAHYFLALNRARGLSPEYGLSANTSVEEMVDFFLYGITDKRE